MSGRRFYYQRAAENGRHEFVRVDLMQKDEFVWEIFNTIPATSRLDISRAASSPMR